MRELIKQDFQADSKRKATYSLIVMALDEGFVIETQRGANGKIIGSERYWRPNAIEAKKLFDRIQKQKTKPCRERVYKPLEEEQYTLFQALTGIAG